MATPPAAKPPAPPAKRGRAAAGSAQKCRKRAAAEPSAPPAKRLRAAAGVRERHCSGENGNAGAAPPQRRNIMRAMIEENGPTPKCPRCNATHQRPGLKGHSRACKARFEATRSELPAGGAPEGRARRGRPRKEESSLGRAPETGLSRRRGSPGSRGGGGSAAAEAALAAEPAPAPCSRVLSLHEVEYPEYPVGLPPGVVAVRRFFALMNARQTVSRNRARGLGGPLAYEGVAEEFAPYLRRRVCPNVRRREDRTTRALHRFCASAARERLCASEAERSWLRKLIVFNFGLWRFIGGTISFAFEVGFVSAWGESEKQRVRDVVERAQREGRIGEVLSEAYGSPNKLRTILLRAAGGPAGPAVLESVLRNTGPRAVPEKEPLLTYYTLVGKLRVLDALWEAAGDVADAASPDPVTGRTRTRPVAEALVRVPFFGTQETSKRRVPTFFAKELVQDLLDTPVFAGGRRNAADLRTYCPAGPGALEGLRLLYGLEERPATQAAAMSMMRALLLQAEGPSTRWEHGDAAELELHDIQFMLCEAQKFLRDCDPAKLPNLRNYKGPPPSSLPGAPGGFWRARLEEALVLAAGEQDAGAPGPGPAARLASWASLPLGERAPEALGSGVPLRNGSRVLLRDAASGSPFALDADKLEVARSGAVGTSFLLESEGAVGEPLAAGACLFLRAPNGAHLGEEQPRPTLAGAARKTKNAGILSAKSARDRFLDGQRLCFLRPPGEGSAGPATGPAISSGDGALLASCSPSRGGPLVVVVRGGACRMVAQGQFEGDCLVVPELDASEPQQAERLRAFVDAAVEDGLLRGGFVRGPDGRLDVADREAVRRRLVGAGAKG